MSIAIKSAREVDIMRVAGRIVGDCLVQLREAAHPGVTTRELDQVARKWIVEHGAEPAFPHINNFPGSVCTSVNDEVVHGIPGKRALRDGDLLKVDVGAIYHGYHGDAAITIGVGSVSSEARRLMEVTERALALGIEACQAGNHLFDIGAAIQEYVDPTGFAIVRQYVGHGTGRELHEDPNVPHYRQASRGMKLRPGMTITIEPMINQGTYETRVLRDNWTVVTQDGRLSAQFEHTVLITEDEPEILTLPEIGEPWGVPLSAANHVH